jgi:hypothetical protein
MTYQSSPLHPEDSRIAASLPCTPNFAGEGDVYKHTFICSHTGSVPAPFFYSPAENRPRIFNYITANNSITENRAYFYSTGFGSCAAGFSPGVTGYISPRVLGFSLRVMGFSLRIMDFGSCKPMPHRFHFIYSRFYSYAVDNIPMSSGGSRGADPMKIVIRDFHSVFLSGSGRRPVRRGCF